MMSNVRSILVHVNDKLKQYHRDEDCHGLIVLAGACVFFNLKADVKIPGLPLKVVMEAIQQATGIKVPIETEDDFTKMSL